MNAKQKIPYIERQITSIELGVAASLKCPYCKATTAKGETLCCMTMGKAVRAILQRQVAQELEDTAARIADAVSRN